MRKNLNLLSALHSRAGLSVRDRAGSHPGRRGPQALPWELALPDRSVGTPCTPSQEISQPGLRRSWELYWPAENKHALRDLNFILKSTKKHEEMSAPKSWAPSAAMRRSKIQPFKDFWWKRLYKLFWILTVNCLHDPESLLDLQFVYEVMFLSSAIRKLLHVHVHHVQ